MDRSTDIRKLRQLVKLVDIAAETMIAEWSQSETHLPEVVDGVSIPSHELYNAQRTLAAAAGSIEELVCDPSLRILGFATQYFESRSLHIAAENRIPDMLDEAAQAAGLHVSTIADRAGIDPNKLSSQNIFREAGSDTFANNRVSQALVRNEPLRAYVMLVGLDPYSSSAYLPVALKHPKLGPSYKVNETSFNLATGSVKSRWGWIQETITPGGSAAENHCYPGSPDAPIEGVGEPPLKDHSGSLEGVPRTEFEIFNLAMIGGGRVSSTPHVLDYPWHELGDATVVDVGGGHGGFARQLSQQYSHLKCIVQDTPAMVDSGRELWERERPAGVSAESVRFTSHDFFQVNPVKDAEVYWLRYILHDWSNDYCIKILSGIRAAMGPNSRLLIADQVMNTTCGSPELAGDRAPEPLLANYGHYVRYSHQRDLNMMTLINGIERTPEQLHTLVEAAGLRLVKVYQCRTQVSIAECRL